MVRVHIILIIKMNERSQDINVSTPLEVTLMHRAAERGKWGKKKENRQDK